MAKTIEFEDQKYSYNPDAFRSYKVAKSLAMAQTNPARFFEALEVIFDGHDEEAAERLGSIDKIGELVNAIGIAEGTAVKN